MIKMPRMKTNEEYIQECKEKGLDLPIEDYKGALTKINHKCKNGHIYLQTPSDHLHKLSGCPTCSGNKKKTPQDYLNECKDKGYDLPIEDYKGVTTKINHKCKYGHIYSQTPSSHLRGQGCPECYGNKQKTPEGYLQECKENGLDLPIEEYKGSYTKINHNCKNGHTYPQTPHNHLRGRGCPVCNESHGEKFIRTYLDKNHIKYIPQKTFEGLKDTQPLSYDFYLPDYNTLIEYQGIQHYEEAEFFGGKEQFKVQQFHDKIKRDYAKDNGYKLLELHYTLDTQDKVNNYLDKYLN